MSILLIPGERGYHSLTFVDIILIALFAILAIFKFVDYFHMIIKRIYIQITNDEIKISPMFSHLDFSSEVIKWEDISRIEQNPLQITLILRTGEDDIIRLNYLNKGGRDNLIQIIKDHIERKPTA
jgi:hypothetical protein